MYSGEIPIFLNVVPTQNLQLFFKLIHSSQCIMKATTRDHKNLQNNDNALGTVDIFLQI